MCNDANQLHQMLGDIIVFGMCGLVGVGAALYLCYLFFVMARDDHRESNRIYGKN